MKSTARQFSRKQQLTAAVAFLLATSAALLPARAIENAGDEKRLETLEQKFFSQTYKTDSDDVRLGRVEDMLFNHARSGSTAERLTSLEEALSTIKSSAKPVAPRHASDSVNQPSGSGVTSSSVGNNSRYRHFTEMDDKDDDDSFDSQASNFYNQNSNARPAGASVAPQSGSMITQQLAAMEQQIFGKTNAKAPLTTRIKKLEQNILASSADTSNMSLPDRVKNLWANLNTPGATTSGDRANQSKNKTTQTSTANNNNSSNEKDDTVAKKSRPQSRSSNDDDVSDDQAMAEYLQKLRKGSPAATSANSGVASTGVSSKKVDRNKSGWVDDADMPKGQDPDYAPTDDNPPIVIGGNGGSSMQGLVQNFGNMPMQSSGQGLFSKLGQAIGGAVSGANNPYGYGGMAGGYPNFSPYGYGGITPYGLSPYSNYGGFSPIGGYGYTPPVMGPLMGPGGYNQYSPYGAGGLRPGNQWGINPYGAGNQWGSSPGYGTAAPRRF